MYSCSEFLPSTPPKETLACWYHHYTIHRNIFASHHHPLPALLPIHQLLSNDTVSLPRRWSLGSIIDWVTSPLRLIAALRLLQLISVVTIVPIVAVESLARRLVWKRWFVGRSRAAIVWLIWVVASIAILTAGMFIAPVASHPACSVHGGHAATATATTIVAPVNYGQ
jgi:hypothetical protein